MKSCTILMILPLSLATEAFCASTTQTAPADDYKEQIIEHLDVAKGRPARIRRPKVFPKMTTQPAYYKGKTAKEWLPLVRDADGKTSREAAQALLYIACDSTVIDAMKQLASDKDSNELMRLYAFQVVISH